MRKVLRYLRYTINCTAAVLCVVIVAAWIASYFRYDGVRYKTGVRQPSTSGGAFERRVFVIGYDPGRFVAQSAVWSNPDESALRALVGAEQGMSWFGGQKREANLWANYWFHAKVRHNTGGLFGSFVNDFKRVEVPMWALLLSPFLWMIFVVRSYRRKRKRARLGLCPNCSYDLRASHDRCPECGTAIPSPAEAKA